MDSAQSETVPTSIVSVPRILEAPASLECREITTMEIGRSRIILGQVVANHVKDALIDPACSYIRPEGLHAFGRMNGPGAYVRTRDSFFDVPRLTYAAWIKAKQ